MYIFTNYSCIYHFIREKLKHVFAKAYVIFYNIQVCHIRTEVNLTNINKLHTFARLLGDLSVPSLVPRLLNLLIYD